jgi:hypothetical protein
MVMKELVLLPLAVVVAYAVYPVGAKWSCRLSDRSEAGRDGDGFGDGLHARMPIFPSHWGREHQAAPDRR